MKFCEYVSTGEPIFAVSQLGVRRDLMAQTEVGIWSGEDEPSEIGEKFLSAMTPPALALKQPNGDGGTISAPCLMSSPN